MEEALRDVERFFGYDYVEPGAQRQLRGLLASMTSLLLDQTYFSPYISKEISLALASAIIDNWVAQNIHHLPRGLGVQRNLLSLADPSQGGSQDVFPLLPGHPDGGGARGGQHGHGGGRNDRSSRSGRLGRSGRGRAVLSPSFVAPSSPVCVPSKMPWEAEDTSMTGPARYIQERLREEVPEPGRGRRSRASSGRGKAAAISPQPGVRARRDDFAVMDDASADWIDRSIGGTDLLGLGLEMGGVPEGVDSPKAYDSASLSSNIASKRAVYRTGPAPVAQPSPFSSTVRSGRAPANAQRDLLEPDMALAVSQLQAGCRALRIVQDPQNPEKAVVKFSVGTLAHGNVIDLRPLVQELLPFNQARPAKKDILEDMVVSATSLLNEHCGYDTLLASVAEKAAAGFYFPATGRVAGPDNVVGFPGFVPTRDLKAAEAAGARARAKAGSRFGSRAGSRAGSGAAIRARVRPGVRALSAAAASGAAMRMASTMAIRAGSGALALSGRRLPQASAAASVAAAAARAAIPAPPRPSGVIGSSVAGRPQSSPAGASAKAEAAEAAEAVVDGAETGKPAVSASPVGSADEGNRSPAAQGRPERADEVDEADEADEVDEADKPAEADETGRSVRPTTPEKAENPEGPKRLQEEGKKELAAGSATQVPHGAAAAKDSQPAQTAQAMKAARTAHALQAMQAARAAYLARLPPSMRSAQAVRMMNSLYLPYSPQQLQQLRQWHQLQQLHQLRALHASRPLHPAGPSPCSPYSQSQQLRRPRRALQGDAELAEFLFEEFASAPPMRTTKSQYSRIAPFVVPPDCVTYRASGGYGDAFAQLLDKDLEALTTRGERSGYQTVEEEMKSRRPAAQRSAQAAAVK